MVSGFPGIESSFQQLTLQVADLIEEAEEQIQILCNLLGTKLAIVS